MGSPAQSGFWESSTKTVQTAGIYRFMLHVVGAGCAFCTVARGGQKQQAESVRGNAFHKACAIGLYMLDLGQALSQIKSVGLDRGSTT